LWCFPSEISGGFTKHTHETSTKYQEKGSQQHCRFPALCNQTQVGFLNIQKGPAQSRKAKEHPFIAIMLHNFLDKVEIHNCREGGTTYIMHNQFHIKKQAFIKGELGQESTTRISGISYP
jgi:hypothetical protein